MATKKTMKKTMEKKQTKNAASSRKTPTASKRGPNPKWTVVGVSGEGIGTDAYEGKKSLTQVEIAEGVTKIGVRAFAGCVNLVSIRIPKSVTYIGNDAFSGCVKLRDVELADGLETIGCEVFAGCAALPAIVKKGRLFFAPVVKGSVSFPAGVTSIADNAFNRNSDLKRITLPGGVRQIGENAFEFCKNLVSVDIPDSVVEIGAEAFSSCCSLRHVKLPGRLKKLGYGVFSSCKMLTSVELPQSVTDLGSSCFEGCERLKSAAVLAKIKALPYDSFKNCSALASIRMPEVSEIGSSAFKGCESLRSFDFARIREIGYDAFAGCKGLKSISFPSTLRSVDRDAFCGCVSLVRVDASPAVLKKINYASVFKGCPLLPPLIVDGVLKFMPVAGERVVIPEGVTEISDNLFEDCEGLKDVVFPSSLKKIGESSVNATGIEKLDLPSGLLEIGEEAFRYCKALKTLTIPDSVKVIESRAFAACTQLASLKLSESIEEIDDGVFAACKSLKEVAIPAGVKVVRDEAFGFCKVLNRITFNSGDTSVHREAFRQCVVVRKVEVPSGLKKECALLDSRGYQSVKSVADRNAKYGEDVELKTAELRLWSYLPTIGTAWVDSLDEVDDDLAECARDEGGWVHALDVSDIGGELEINGADVGIDFKLVRRVEAGIENTWSEFRNKIGIYSVDIDKSGCSTVFAIAGDFDPKKLTLYYKTAIGPGYYKHPEDVTIDLLDRVEYDGLELELDYDDDPNNKGCMFTVFNGGQYAGYEHGCDVDDLSWKPFPSCNNWGLFSPCQWAALLSDQPQFADKCEVWNDFTARDWSCLLARNPRFAGRCDKWNEFGACHWAELISSQPRFADKCDKWEIFDDADWREILCAQPQFFERFKECRRYFHGGDWLKVLSKQPQLASGKIDWLGGPQDARDLIVAQPQFAKQCGKFGGMDDLDLAVLAASGICKDRFLKLKKPSAWAVAIALSGNPRLAGKVKISRVMGAVDEEQEDKLWNDDGLGITPWASPAAFLIRNQPSFVKEVDVSEFSCLDWLCVLQKQPQLADRCDWSRFEEEWCGEDHAMYLENDELISLLRKNTDIDVTEGMDIITFMTSPLLMKEFDASGWRDPVHAWCAVLCRYPEKAADFERDWIPVEPEEDDETNVSSGEEDMNVRFCYWNDWGESEWRGYERKLAKRDAATKKQFQEQWREETEEGADFDEELFLAYACKRSPDWAFLISDQWGEVLKKVPSLLDDKEIAKKVKDWCNEEEIEDGYYPYPDFGGVWVPHGEYALEGSRWAAVLAINAKPWPDFDETAFLGLDRCWVLAHQPQFAEKWDLQTLADPNAAMWTARDCDKVEFSFGWAYLLMKQPQLAEGFTGWEGICVDEDWDMLLKERPEFASKRVKKSGKKTTKSKKG